jgi:putative transposase
VGQICYHVINRGNRRETVFHDPDEFREFDALLERTQRACPTRIVAYCLMPNHFHMVMWPRADGEMGRFLQILTTTHVRRYHGRHGTSGRVWQERYKSFPIQRDDHLLRVLRYVERNPVRAGLVGRAAEWRWSSVQWWRAGVWPQYADPGPVARPVDWEALLDEPERPAEVEAIRSHVDRGRPFGDEGWTERTAHTLGLEKTLRPRGRPPRNGSGKGDCPLF